jgi:hypothetical protein
MGEFEETNRTYKVNAIKRAAEEIYPSLFRYIVDESLEYDSDETDYELPTDFQTGELCNVEIDDDIIFNWKIIQMIGDDDHTILSYVRLPDDAGGEVITLRGYAPFEELEDEDDEIPITGGQINLLTSYAKYKYFQALQGLPAADDVSRYKETMALAYAEYQNLLRKHKMVKPQSYMNVG